MRNSARLESGMRDDKNLWLVFIAPVEAGLECVGGCSAVLPRPGSGEDTSQSVESLEPREMLSIRFSSMVRIAYR